MKKLMLIFSAVVALVIMSCADTIGAQEDSNQSKSKGGSFKIIGYALPDPTDPEAKNIRYKYLTHINYAFGLPTKDASGNLEPLPGSDYLLNLVEQAHKNDVKVLLSIGGWSIGDGGGDDTRFEELADKKKSRHQFVKAVVDTVDKYNLDGADIDWEYPDPIEPSSSNYVKLMKELGDALHKTDKKLTAAIVTYGDKHGYGIKDEVFEIVDWLNIMAYDDDYNTFDGANVPHSPYWLGVRSLEYWKERGLSPEKSILGVPFYGKRHGVHYHYNTLVKEKGADPYADVKDSIYYNGIKTIKQKTQLAKEKGNGIMIWELGADLKGQKSLLKAIYEAAQ